MKKWEYKSVVCVGSPAESLLNEHGEEGWEMVSRVSGCYLIFKREKDPESLLVESSQPRTLTLKEVLDGAERAAQRVSNWPKWKREIVTKPTKLDDVIDLWKLDFLGF
jgi:hypothetical protein